MNKRQITRICSLYLQLHTELQRQDSRGSKDPRGGSDFLLTYMDIASGIFDPNIQVTNVEMVLDIAEKFQRDPIVQYTYSIEEMEELEIENPTYPYEVGITVESVYFYAFCDQATLEKLNLPVPEPEHEGPFDSKRMSS